MAEGQLQHGSADHTAHTSNGDHGGDHGHGAGHHAPPLGRYIEHPPEPPHLIQIWYKMEQKGLQKKYAEKHGIDLRENPHFFDHNAVEGWLKKDPETGEWVEVEGQGPTLAQVLHAGTLKEKYPLIGYAPWENHVFLALAFGVMVGMYWVLTSPFRRDKREVLRRPTRAQACMEMITGGFDDFCKGILGEQNGRLYMPYIATLFSLILICNLMGLIPLLRAPSASIIITGSFALCTFIVVQATAWTRLGPATYIHHLMGSPKDAIGWFLSPLFLILEIISDFIAKPASLALRLFGNIFGKDILLGAFLGMGITLVGTVAGGLGNYVGLPLTFPFYFLGLLLSTIQALVFALLTCIYISMVLPHDHDHHHDHDHEGHHGEEEHVGSPIEHVGSGDSQQTGVVNERLPS